MQTDEINNNQPALEQASVSGNTMLHFKPMPISIVIRSGNEQLGRFYEADGLLTFEGKVDEAGQMFVDFVINTFKSRIEELYGHLLNKKMSLSGIMCCVCGLELTIEENEENLTYDVRERICDKCNSELCEGSKL